MSSQEKTLPPEISSMIFNHLRDDAPSLHSASLTFRSWTKPCRMHLFRRLIVHICTKCKRAATVKAPSLAAYERLYQLLQSYPELCSYITEIQFLCHDGYGPFSVNPDTEFAPLQLLALLRNVKVVEFSNIDWERHTLQLRTAIRLMIMEVPLARFKADQYSFFPCGECFFSLFNHTPTLKSLLLGSALNWRKSADGVCAEEHTWIEEQNQCCGKSERPQLIDLHIGSHTTELLPWLVNPRCNVSIASVKTLTLTGDYPCYPAPTIAPIMLLRYIGSSLTSLRCNDGWLLPNDHLQDPTWSARGEGASSIFHYNPNLEELVVLKIFLRSKDKRLPPFLSSLSEVTRLRRLSLYFRQDGISMESDWSHFRDLDEAILDACADGRVEVSASVLPCAEWDEEGDVCLVKAWTANDITQLFTNNMPRLAARNMLKILEYRDIMMLHTDDNPV